MREQLPCGCRVVRPANAQSVKPLQCRPQCAEGLRLFRTMGQPRMTAAEIRAASAAYLAHFTRAVPPPARPTESEGPDA